MNKYLSILKISKFRKEDAIITKKSVETLKSLNFKELWDIFYKQNIYPRHQIRKDGRLEIGRPISFFYRFLIENGIIQAPFIMISEKDLTHKEYLKTFNIFELKKFGDLFLSSLFQISCEITVREPFSNKIYEYSGFSHIDYLSNLTKDRLEKAKEEAINHAWAKIWFSPQIIKIRWFIILIFWIEFESKKLNLNLSNYRVLYYLGYEYP